MRTVNPIQNYYTCFK